MAFCGPGRQQGFGWSPAISKWIVTQKALEPAGVGQDCETALD